MKFRVNNFRAIPQGGHKAFVVKTKTGMTRAVITDSNGDAIRTERVVVAEAYRDAGGMNYGDVAIKMGVIFAFTRPKTVTAKKRPYPNTRPDIDKLLRAILDSMTGHAFNDDSQVVELSARKIYSDEEYIEIEIEPYIQQAQQTL